MTPGLMAATESHQGSLGARALWYFCICMSQKSNTSVPSPAVGFSPKRCCELPTPRHIDRQMFLTHFPLPLRSCCPWWQRVFSAALAGEQLDLPKCGKLPLCLLGCLGRNHRCGVIDSVERRCVYWTPGKRWKTLRPQFWKGINRLCPAKAHLWAELSSPCSTCVLQVKLNPTPPAFSCGN